MIKNDQKIYSPLAVTYSLPIWRVLAFIFVLFAQNSFSQTVQKELVENGDFDSNNTYRGYDSDVPTNYSNGGNGGSHDITDDPDDTWNWAPSFGDHTPGNNMMVVDGASWAGHRIWYNNFYLEAGRTYTFSVWVRDFWGGSNAGELYWSVDGSQVGTTVKAVDGVWTQLEVTFVATTTGFQTIAIHNNQGGNSGNDFAIDDVSIIEEIIPTCSGNFYDSGGPFGDYSDDEDYYVTYCAPYGQRIRFDFTTFRSERRDRLDVYDGIDQNADRIDRLERDEDGKVITSSDNCLTFRWNSNGRDQNEGWNATISCVDDNECEDLSQLVINDLGGGADIDITAGATIYSNQLPSSWNLEAIVNGVSGSDDNNGVSVTFDITGDASTSNTENTQPYRSPNDNNPYTWGEGTYYITTTLYEDNGAGGKVCGLLETELIINECNLVGLNPTSNGPLCAGATLNFTSGTLPGGSTYSWVGPNGFTSSNETPSIPNVTTSATGIYTVTAEYDGCTATATVAVLVEQVPQAIVGLTEATCGLNDGAITFTFPDVSGRSGLEFSLNGGSSYLAQVPDNSGSVTYSGQAPGTYSLWVRWDNDECPVHLGDYTILQSRGTMTVTGDLGICIGESTTLTATLQNGVSPVNYSWGSGLGTGASKTVTPNMSTVYNVTATDASGCSATATVQVVVHNLPVVFPSSNSPVCGGGTLNLTSNSGFVSYLWTDPLNNTYMVKDPTISPVNVTYSGSYKVEVVDVNGCVNSDSTNVTVTSTMNPTASNTGPFCEGQTINLNATGGNSYGWVGPDAFSSSGASVSAGLATISKSGVYTVTATQSGSGCSATATTNVIVLSSSITASNNGPECSGGSIQLSVSGGGTTFTWAGPNGFSSTQQNPLISNVNSNKEGTYTVTSNVTSSCPVSATTEITVFSLPNASVMDTVKVCTGDDANLTASGGISYQWVGPGGFSETNTSGNITVTNVTNAKSGIYTVTVFNAAGCSATATTSLTLALPALTVSSNSPVCVGNSIQLNSSGGISYSWLGPGGFSSGTANTTISSATTANEGIYTLTVANSLGCTATSTVEVNILTSTPTITGTPEICAGDTLKLAGENWIDYSWTGPNGFSSTLEEPFIADASTAADGTYSVTVSKPGGCTATATFAVIVNPLPTITISGSSTLCQFDDLSLTATGGISYSWTGPEAFSSSSSGASVSSIDTLEQGYYVVEVTDAEGCVNKDSVNVVVNYTSAEATGDEIVCYGSTISLASNTGQSYSWSGPNGFSSTAQTASISNVGTVNSGDYILEITGTNSCVNRDTLSVVVSEPNAQIVADSIYCDQESVVLGGLGGNSFQWSGPAGFSSTLPNPAIAKIIPSRSGYYYLTVTDSASCVDTDTMYITIRNLPNISASSSNNPVCLNETLNLSASGGISYLWSGPDGYASGDQNATLPNIQNIHAGMFYVQGTDAYGCQNIDSVDVTVNPLPTVIAFATNNDVCVEDVIDLTASGAQSYSWLSPDGATKNGSTWGRNNVTPAMSGSYLVTGTSSLGCTNAATTFVTVHPFPDPPAAADVNICGAGTATLTASGCVGTINWYATNNTNTVLATGNTYTTPYMNIGDVEYYYADCIIYTCESQTRTEVRVEALQPPFNIQASTTGIHCAYTTAILFGSADNAVAYRWDGPNGFTSNAQSPKFVTSPSSDGIYTLTATAANGCTETATTELVINTDCGSLCGTWLGLLPTNPSNCGATDGYILAQDYGNGRFEVSIDGINWIRSTHSTSTGRINNLGVGSHLVFVKDRSSQNICRTVIITLTSNGGNFFTGSSVAAASECFAFDGSITLQGVTGTDEVSWIGLQDREYVPVSSLSPANTIDSLQPGSYYVRVKRYNSAFCYKEQVITVPNSGTPCQISTFCEVGPEGNKFVNGDFGSGVDVQCPPLPEEQTGYGYVFMNCNSPNDGFYTIVNELDCNGSSNPGGGIFGGSWATLPEDHTPGDTGGYMMVVNASYEPNVVVEQLIGDLCPNSKYNFTAWIRDTHAPGYNGIRANLAFLIDGVSKYTTGNITVFGEWIQVGFSFQTGNISEAVFSIRNNAPGGGGNDWIIDDIVVSKCPLEIDLSGTTIACLGGLNEQISATVTDPLEEYTYYKWQESTDGGVTWTDVSTVQQGTYNSNVMDVSFSLPTPVPSAISGVDYQIILSTTSDGFNSPGCVVTSGLTKILVPPIEMSITQDTIKCIGSGSLTLESFPSGGGSPYTFEWSTGETSQSILVNPSITTEYIVTARDSAGCPVTDTVLVEVENQPTLTVSIDEDSVCVDGVGDITAHVIGGSGNFEFTWFTTLDTNGIWTEVVGEKDSVYMPPTNVAGDRFYRVFVEDLTFDCNDAMSNAVLFIVVSDPFVSVNVADTTLCASGAVTLIPMISGGTGNLTYQWQSSASGNAPWTDLAGETSQNLTVPSSTPGVSFYRMVVNSDGNGCNYPPSDSARVEVLPNFSVDVVIDSSLVCADGLVELVADTSSGTGTITYQWFSSTDAVTFNPITDSTNSNLFPSTSSEGIMYYQVQATASGAGCGTVSSDTAMVQVLPEFIVDLVTDDAVVCIGGLVELEGQSISGFGTITYQWFVSANEAGPYTLLSGAVNDTYTPATGFPGIRYFQIEATASGAGCGMDTSEVVSVQVLPEFSVDVTLNNSTICLGGEVELVSDTTNGTGDVTYRWFESTNPAGPFTEMVGQTDSALTVTPTTAGIHYYFIVATASGPGCGSVNSDTASVEVLPNFSVDVAADDNLVCIGGLVEILADTNSGTGTVSYQWYQSADGITFTTMTDSTGSSIFPNTSSEGVNYYKVIATSDGEGCGTAESDTARVEVLPVFDVDVTVNNALVCIGGAVQLEADTVNGTGNITYQWFSSSNSGGPFTAISGETDSVYVPSTAADGIIYYQVQATASGAGCGTVTSDVATVEVLPVFSVDVTANGNVICLGGTVELLADTINGTGNITYKWFSSTSAGGPFNEITTDTDSLLTITPTVEGMYYYYVEVTSDGPGCGTVSSAVAAIEVLPNFDVEIVVNNAMVCTDGFVELEADTISGTGTITYQWQYASDGVSFSDITDSTGTSLVPSTADTGVFYYRVIAVAQGNGCGTATSEVAVVEIEPQVRVELVPSALNICEGEPVVFEANPQEGIGPFTFQWQSFDGTSWNDISGENDTLYTPSTAVPGQFTYRVLADANGVGCDQATSTQYTLTVYDLPDVTVTSTDPLCVPNNGQITFTFNDEANRDSIQFSLDGGLTYPYHIADDLGSFSIDTLSEGTYLLFARWDGNYCPQDLGSVTISDRPAPVVAVSFTDPTCTIDNGTITFSFPDESTRTQLEFSWDGGTTFQTPVNDNSGSIVYSNFAPGTYDLWVRWENDECPVDLGSVIMVDHPSPIVSVNQDTTICIGVTVNLLASSTGGDAPIIYSWDNGLSDGSAQTVTPSVTTNYIVTATDTNSCFDQDTVTITVNPLPVVVANGGIFCEGEDITLISSGGDTYSWSGPDSFSSTDQNPIRANGLTSYQGTYTVNVLDVNGCSSSDTAAVVVNAAPASPNISDQFLCGPGEITFSASGCSGGTLSWYSSYDALNPIGFGTTFVTDSLNATSYYYVSCTDANDCQNFERSRGVAEIRDLSNAEAIPINTTCAGAIALNNGVILINGFRSGETYSFSQGSTYNAATAIPAVPAVIPEDGRIYEDIGNPSGATETYTVRIYSLDNCPVDHTVEYQRQCDVCFPYCEPTRIEKVK